MVDAGLHSIIIKVACLGLTAKHLGSSIAELEPVMLSLADKYGCNVCGEGGEFETLTLDGPMFPLGRIEITVCCCPTHCRCPDCMYTSLCAVILDPRLLRFGLLASVPSCILAFLVETSPIPALFHHYSKRREGLDAASCRPSCTLIYV